MTTQAPYEDKHSCIVTIRYMFCCHAVFFYPLALHTVTESFSKAVLLAERTFYVFRQLQIYLALLSFKISVIEIKIFIILKSNKRRKQNGKKISINTTKP